MAALAPHGGDNPRVVLLSPGPYNATYFEQAFLAQYLGYMLVEGADLTVREGCVYVKTLGGLHRVDVIRRRLNDDFCDPLELRADSALGVPGLLEAVREGNVAIANALGSGVVQTAALMPFLPAVCRALLGEELALPSVETWWCGEPRVLAHVLAQLGDMVIKPAFPTGRIEPIFCDELDAAALVELRARLQANPSAWVAQRRATLSTTPLWEAGELKPRRLLMRSFAVSDAGSAVGGGYHVMPGGLGVVAAGDQRHDISIQRGATQPGHLGRRRRPREHALAAAPGGRARRAVARRRRPAEPRRRQPLLARALRRARSTPWRGSRARPSRACPTGPSRRTRSCARCGRRRACRRPRTPPPASATASPRSPR